MTGIYFSFFFFFYLTHMTNLGQCTRTNIHHYCRLIYAAQQIMAALPWTNRMRGGDQTHDPQVVLRRACYHRVHGSTHFSFFTIFLKNAFIHSMWLRLHMGSFLKIFFAFIESLTRRMLFFPHLLAVWDLVTWLLNRKNSKVASRY